MRVFDWLFRTAMLALAGLVTLSMLASIAAISTETGPSGWIGSGEPPAAQPAAEPVAERVMVREGAEEPAEGDAGAGTAGAVPEEPGRQRWLEAIAYALLAVAGLVAIALLLLAGAARDLRRIADSLSDRPR